MAGQHDILRKPEPRHRAVAEAAVTGRSDELTGQAIAAFVTLKAGYEPSTELAAELTGHVADRFDLHRHIRYRTEVTDVVWHEDDRRWHVHATGPEGREVEHVARAIARGLGIDAALGVTEGHEAWIDALVRDLKRNRGAAVVVAGEHQPPVVHALAHAMNEALDAFGKTVVLIEPGNVFFHDPPYPCPYFRLRLSSISPERIAPGLTALAAAVQELARARGVARWGVAH